MKYFLISLIVLLCCCNSEPPPEFYKKDKPPTIIKKTKKFLVKKKNKKELYSKLINNTNVKKKLSEYGRENPSNRVKITTKYGNIYIKLYDQTPLHKANFIMLANKGFFDSTLFYRVIKNFMIQGGNSDKDNMLHKMAKIGNYRIPPEINLNYIHKRGALAMAVQEQYFIDPSKHNPSSSPYNFYIVQKGPISDKYMDKIEKKYEIDIPSTNRDIYKSIGGNPHLDNQYTVFGEVVKGMNVVDKISSLITDGKNRPLKNVYLTMKVLN